MSLRERCLLEAISNLRCGDCFAQTARNDTRSSGGTFVKTTLSFSNWISFLGRQARDWKVTVMRTSFDRLAYQMVFPYLSIYILALGASATQLGFVISFGMMLAGLLAPFTGWYIDRIGPKKIYLLGIGMLGVSYLTYGLARDWTITFIAMIAYWVGFSVSNHSCATVCGNCLANSDRATGMMICETFGAGLLGMAGPILGAALVALFGGVNEAGIRPLFFLAFLFSLGTFVFVSVQLSNQHWKPANAASPHLLRDLHQVLKDGRNLKRWLIIASIGGLPLGMVFPFSQVFAHEIKGANEFFLAAMVTCAALSSILFAIPLGRLADKIGRKKILFATIPLFWLSNLILIWSPHPIFLLVAGALQGFFYIGGPIAGAMERELVPAEQMGRWLGIARLIKMLTNACFTALAGIVWDKVGPQFVFLTFVAIDLIVRVPLLLAMPETLRLRTERAALVESGD
ncbi:MAG: MFS transporter [Chloroflexi bacterium]|nr:MFS transporter [Chloroflexota bacterium]